MPLDEAQLIITNLGFTVKTEKHSDCVMKLIDNDKLKTS